MVEFIYPTSGLYLDKYDSLGSSTAAGSYNFSAPPSAMIPEAWEVPILYKCSVHAQMGHTQGLDNIWIRGQKDCKGQRAREPL